MNRRFALASSVALLFALGLVACESSSSSGPPATPDASPTLDGGGDDSPDEPPPSKCPEPTGAPIKHDGNIEKDETWAAGIHDVIFDVGVRKNATLTIAPCAVIRVVTQRGISVGTGNAGDGGKIIAKGKADLPIVFQGKDGVKWGGLQINPLGLGDLAYVTIKDGGDRASRGGAALHLLGDGNKPLQPLATVDH